MDRKVAGPEAGYTEVRTSHPEHGYVEIEGDAASALLLSSPHSGRHYPPELLRQARLPLEDIRRLEDPFVDLLLGTAVAEGVPVITASYARAWIDLNRRETELDPKCVEPAPKAHVDQRSPRVLGGLGVIPMIAGSGRQLYSAPFDAGDVAYRIATVHRGYHGRIASRLRDMRTRHGTALLCDMHSMPTLIQQGQPVDFVIGDRHGKTASGWIAEAVLTWLRDRGFRAVGNMPYAGGHGVERHGDPSRNVHAIQIEIDRRLYLKDRCLELGSGAPLIAELIAALTAMLRGLLESPSTALAAE